MERLNSTRGFEPPLDEEEEAEEEGEEI